MPNQESILTELVPDVLISNISIQNHNNGMLLIRLSLIIQEKLSDDLIGSWFEDINFKKYLKIRVIQSNEDKITALLSLSQDFLEILNINMQMNKNDPKIKLTGHVLETNNMIDLVDQINNFTFQKLFSVSKLDKLNTFKEEVDENGNKVINIPFNVEFKIRTDPKHLSYFIVSFLDIKELAKDFNLDFDSLSFDKENGKIVSEVVIDDFQVISNSFVFLDKDNNIWNRSCSFIKKWNLENRI